MGRRRVKGGYSYWTKDEYNRPVTLDVKSFAGRKYVKKRKGWV